MRTAWTLMRAVTGYIRDDHALGEGMTDAIRYEIAWQYGDRMMMTALVKPARQIEAVWSEAAARITNAWSDRSPPTPA